MEYRTIYLNQYSSKIELTRFAAADVEEAHAILHVDANGELFESQLRRLQLSLQTFMQELEMEGHKMVFMRYFLSDATNQAPLIEQTGGCTVSFIQQPPLDGSKVVFTIIEWIRGKPINRKVEAVIHMVGLVLLFGLAIGLDIFHLVA